MAKVKGPSAAVLAARGRRKGRSKSDLVRLEWYADTVSRDLSISMKRRVRIATNILRDRVVKNISRPVTKLPGGQVTNRSKRGEYPKADTTSLMKSIMIAFKHRRYRHDGYVGTTLRYGAILEMSSRLDRSYLRKTLKEVKPIIIRMLTRKISK